ncbi:MAG: hypothetical protein JW731_17040 [Bacteroidales bacterium]|nr:hypothetical protein [Bacteroidales bacterium]
MKKFLTFFALLTFTSLFVTAQPTLTWQFANYKVINAGTQLQFDVEVKASAAGTFHRDLQVYFDYNTTAFGTDIVTNGAISYTPLTLMNASKYFVVNAADNTASKFAVITEAYEEMDEVGSSTYYEEVTTSFQGLLRFTIDIMPGMNTQMCGIAFDQALMNGGQYYQSTSLVEPVKYTDPSLYEGAISTLKLSTLYGTITYANISNPTPLSSCTVDGGSIGTALTDVNGFYNFSGIDDGMYILTTTSSLPYTYVTTLGDVNVEVSHLLGSPLTGLYFLAGEVTGDGLVSLGDYNLMVGNLVGSLSGYPAVPGWRFEQHTVNVVNGIGTLDFEGIQSGDTTGSWQ